MLLPPPAETELMPPVNVWLVPDFEFLSTSIGPTSESIVPGVVATVGARERFPSLRAEASSGAAIGS